MRSDQMYYAAFSAALMAGAEPGLAQRLAYQLAYLALSSPVQEEPPACESSSDLPEWSQHSQAGKPMSIRPINPLSHVDWLNGGALNERGSRLGQHGVSGHYHYSHEPREVNRPPKQPTPEEKYAGKINRAILLAMTNADSLATSKFVAALYQYMRATKPDGSDVQHDYWLLMHTIRCFLFGTTFQWQSGYAKSTDSRQQSKPMYPVIKALWSCFEGGIEEPELSDILSEQLSCFSPTQQVQCLSLGIAFRPELLNDYNLANHASQSRVYLHELDDAQLWLENA
ncbi:hypothetical protein CKF94_18555 [Vibrio coralliilyticus]|uniref:hypothetical protein n=1 Tax=Vibrio coralliilyticus TaxID=190893 RepID=UPI000BAA976F|nr:hypothetical protein [Vibrio coralliilyticus]PAU36691.1 hypothetical protein CKF94_18555 [Vibrio coralliilyticus]